MEKQLVEHVAPHSVQLSTNAKGKVQCEVKVYDADPGVAAARALEVLGLLRKQLGDQMAAG
ncbi:MAG: hypothetical protein KIT14_13850 [bacterium]|nr:hypothetical protein [bacterium]